MEDHVRVRLKYVELVRAGKLKKAQKVLESIWGRKPKVVVAVDKTKPKVEKIVESKPEQRSLDSLCRIKGIGKKTVKDIKVMFKNIEYLKIALKEDRVALRDDIVEKLKEELI